MYHIYLNSLYSLLVENSPVIQVWQEIRKNIKALWNFRGNMAYVSQKQVRLVRQYQTIEAYVIDGGTTYKPRLDVRR